MAASRIIVSENIEIPVIDGKVQCIRCRNWKLPGEMHSNDRTCQECYEDIRVRNRNKPKPKKDNGKIIKRNGMGWIERVEKPTRAVGDSGLAKMILLERAADRDILSKPITNDGISVSETNNWPINNDSLKSIIGGGIIVSETTSNIVSETEAQSAKFPSKTEAFDGITVSDTKNNCADDDYSNPIAKNGIRVSDTDPQLTDNVQKDTLATIPITEDGIRVSDTSGNIVSETKPQSIICNPRPKAEDGIRISDTDPQLTDNVQKDTLATIPITEDGIRVSDTSGNIVSETKPQSIICNPRPKAEDGIRISDTDPQLTDNVQKDTLATIPITEDGIRVSDTSGNIVSETKPQSIICNPRPKAEDGIRVSETRLIELERAIGFANESLATALRRIRALEEKIEKLSPVIEKEEAKRDAAGLQKLRDDLFKLLRERMDKTHTNGIYVHSLYGKNGRRGGKLNISKMQAFRLRDACRGDDRFRVEKTENQQGNWAILLNVHMN